MNTIIDNIYIEKYNSIEREREQVLSDTAFISWCRELKIGSRVEVVDYRARELQMQYESNYTKWFRSKS